MPSTCNLSLSLVTDLLHVASLLLGSVIAQNITKCFEFLLCVSFKIQDVLLTKFTFMSPLVFVNLTINSKRYTHG